MTDRASEPRAPKLKPDREKPPRDPEQRAAKPRPRPRKTSPKSKSPEIPSSKAPANPGLKEDPLAPEKDAPISTRKVAVAKTPKPTVVTGPFFVYFLVTTRTRSVYVGATIDLAHRFRQHCCELVGGAKITHRAVDRGETWSMNRYVSGFPTWNVALKFEWRWKFLANRGLSKAVRTSSLSQSTPGLTVPRDKVGRYLLALRLLLAQDRISAAVIPYSQWPVYPEVHILTEGAPIPGTNSTSPGPNGTAVPGTNSTDVPGIN